MVLRVNSSVLWQRLPDGAVILEPSTEVYYGLNPVGTRIWELLLDGLTDVPLLAETIAAEFPGAEISTVRTDVSELLLGLTTNGLLLDGGESGADSQREDRPGRSHGDHD